MYNYRDSLVSQQPGWTILLGSLLIAVVLGGGLRVFFGPEVLREWVLKKFEEVIPQYQLNLGLAHISLSHGGFPHVALILHDIQLETADPCYHSAKIKIDQVEIPLKFFKLLFQQDIQIGLIQAQNVDLVLRTDRTQCQKRDDLLPFSNEKQGETQNSKTQMHLQVSKENTEGNAVGNKEAEAPVITFEDSLESSNSIEGIDLLQAIAIQKFHFEYSPREEWNMRFENFGYEKYRDGRIEVSGIVGLNEKLTWGIAIPKINFQGFFEGQELKVKLRGSYREGLFQGNFFYDRVTEQMELIWGLKDFPLEKVFQYLKAAHIYESHFDPKQIWVSCGAQFRYDNKHFKWDQMLLRNCTFAGDVGEVQVARFEWDPQKHFEPFKILIKDAPIDKMRTLFNYEHPSPIFAHLGILNGELDVQSLEKVQFQGDVKNLELVFSNQGRRQYQKLSLMNVDFHFRDHRWGGLINHIEVDQGGFNGQVTFSFDKTLKEGLVQLQIEELVFSQGIQKLMFGESLSPLQGYGKLIVEEQKIRDMIFDLGVQDMKGSDYSIHNLKIQVTMNPLKAIIKPKAEKVFLKQGSLIHSFFKPMLLEYALHEQELEFIRISGLGVLDRQNLSLKWDRFVSQIPQGKIILGTQGGWTSGGELFGWLSVDDPKHKLIKWDVLGTRQQPRIESRSRKK